MTKTPTMRVIELERGLALEELLPQLFAQLGTMDRVADDLKIHRLTLASWLDDLGFDIERNQTLIRRRGEAVAPLG